MKKCPFCKADIEDNARFCLYCMKTLNEKEVIPPPQKKTPWWPFVLAASLVIALLAIILLIPRGNNSLPDASTGESVSTTAQTQASETTVESTQSGDILQNGPSSGEIDPTGEKPDGNQTPTQNQGTQKPAANTKPATPESTPQTTQPVITPTQPKPTTSTQPKPTTQATQPKPTTQATQPATTPTQPESVTQTSPPTTEPPVTPQETIQPEETTAETTLPETTTAPESPKTEAVYSYRAAQAGDDFNAQYQNTGNDIVITGISQFSSDGVYDIPSYIDGKKVIAIAANAFSGSNARIVYVPTTVKTIWNYAFAGCSLTDIYFRGNAIYTETKAFDHSLTIHCSASCSDRNFRYYKNCAANYGAIWKEWNG